MKTELSFGNIKWIHLVDPKREEINKLVEKYDFHELIEEDLIDFTTQEKIDMYEWYLSMVLNFPKYDDQIRKYLHNEFSVILWKDIIITMTKYETNHIKKIIEDYSQELKEREADEDYKISTYYILYRVIDTLYDKAMNVLNKSSKDVMVLEEELFRKNRLEKKFLEDLMIKKRNIVSLKHMFMPHQDILQDLQKMIYKIYQEELDVYFEDLSYKHDKIMNNLAVSFENVESLSETYNTLMNLKTNSVINVLTVFSVITWVLTLISGIYGMNINLPWQWDAKFFYALMMIMFVVCVALILFFRKKKRI